ncbi:hypothetical protein GUJ93_ZPchr0008g14061, partial [Zizania palustris]
TSLWTSLTYYAIGYAPSPIRFFQQLLVLFFMHQMSMGLYRLLASIGRTQVMANTLGTTALIPICILGGFIIPKDELQPWLRWGYWASPFTYAQNAISMNEFLDNRWAKEFHYANANTIGKVILKIKGLLIDWQWYWICVSILFGFSVVFNILSIFTLQFLNPPYKHKVNINIRKVNMDYNIQISGDNKASTNRVILPFEPLSLVFNHINYFVDMPKEMIKYGVYEKRLQLLRDVSGAFRPGVLTALVGITGAGKTTLLDVLAGRKTEGYIEGTITLAGHPKKQEMFTRVSGYCEQTDIHSPNLPIYESLQYAAWLRLPSHFKSCERDMYIEEVMDLVELTGLMNTMVGFPGATGLTAEQRKRLTIAVELLAGPSIIFMDEPTTSLDSRGAAIVMRTAIPGVPRIHKGQNPATWMLDISSQATEYRIGLDYAQIYHESSLYKQNMLQVDEQSKPEQNKEDIYFPPGTQSSSHHKYLLRINYYWHCVLENRLDNPIVAMERVVLYRETTSGMYSAIAYAIAQIAIEVPYMLVQVFIYTSIVYPMTVTLTPNVEIAAALSFLIFILWNIFSGFIILKEMIPVWWRWMYWADPAAWTVYGLTFSQLGDRMEVIHVPGRMNMTVREYLEVYIGLHDGQLPLMMVLHLMAAVLMATLFYLSIKHLRFQRR